MCDAMRGREGGDEVMKYFGIIECSCPHVYMTSVELCGRPIEVKVVSIYEAKT